MSLPQRSPATHLSRTRKLFSKKHLRKFFFETLEDRRVFATDTLPLAEWAEIPYTEDRLLVQFVAGTSAEQRAAVYQQTGTNPVDYWPELNTAVLDLPGDGKDVLGAAQVVNNQPFVQSVSPSFKVEGTRVPDDPFFNFQWAHQNTGQIGLSNFAGGMLPGPGTPGADIKSSVAWDLTTGSRETVIAIIDSGVDYFHPDLRPNLWTNPFETFDGKDNDGNGYADDVHGYDFTNRDSDPMDDNGHGTHVAGIAAAVGNNGIGVAGVSWNSKIMVLKADDVAGVIGAIRYTGLMRIKGINIVASNNSYGLFNYAKTLYPPIYDAINYAANAGVSFIAASGNDTLNLDTVFDTPSMINAPGLISVASTDRNDDLSFFSNWGPASVHIAAPGSNILSTWPTTITNSGLAPVGYDFLDGTSMSAPYVTGAVAILRSIDPSLTPEETKQILLNSSEKLTSLEGRVSSGGRLDLAAAIAAIPHVTITGQVFNDLNGNGKRDANESALNNFSVYIDANNNGRFDANETFVKTGANGAYTINSFGGVGQYVVRLKPPVGWNQTTPASGAVVLNATNRAATFRNVTFAAQANPGSVRGTKYLDVNGNGTLDAADRGLKGVTVYIDANNDGILNVGEHFTVTAADGSYVMHNVPAGAYVVREKPMAGFAPAAIGSDFTTIVVTSGRVTTAGPLLNVRANDYGDAPRPYPTTRQQGGAYHGILPSFHLGSTVDAEANGVRSRIGFADYDDTNGLDDEDGLVFRPLFGGSRTTVQITVTNTTSTKGYFDLWIDYNGNGKWEEGTEHVFKSLNLKSGTTTLGFIPPRNIGNGPIYARARYGDSNRMLPTGFVNAGEVEDYALQVQRGKAVAVNDPTTGVYTVQPDSNFASNPLRVLANDLGSRFGKPQLVAGSLVSPPSKGTVRINGNGTPNDRSDDFYQYRPNPGEFGEDSFTYRVWDGNSFSNVATVSLFIQPGPITPIDDFRTVFVGTAFAANQIDVRQNDLGPAYTSRITDVQFVSTVESPTQIGVLRVNTKNTATGSDDVLEYRSTVVGIESYEYTLTDSLGRVTKALVTIQTNNPPTVGTDPSDSTRDTVLANIIAIPTDENGNPVTSANPGDQFYVTVYTQDARNPTGTIDYGIKGATADLLYDSRLFDAIGIVMENFDSPPLQVYNIQIGSQDPTQNGALDVPGIVNEVGGTNDPLTDPNVRFNSTGLIVLYRVLLEVRPDVPSGLTTTNFYVDPADAKFADPAAPPGLQPHDALFNEEAGTISEPVRIGQNNINYVQFTDFVINGSTPLVFTSFASSAPSTPAENTSAPAPSDGSVSLFSPPNPVRFDVNGDNRINVDDILFVLSSLQAHQQGASFSAEQFSMLDVSGNGNFDIDDLLHLVSEVTRRNNAVDSIFGSDGGDDDLFA